MVNLKLNDTKSTKLEIKEGQLFKYSKFDDVFLLSVIYEDDCCYYGLIDLKGYSYYGEPKIFEDMVEFINSEIKSGNLIYIRNASITVEGDI